MVLQPPQIGNEDVHALLGRIILENLELSKKVQWYAEQFSSSETEIPLEEEVPSDLSKDEQES